MSRCGDPLDLMEPLGTELARHDPMFSSKSGRTAIQSSDPGPTLGPSARLARSMAPDRETGQPRRGSSRIIVAKS